MRIISLIILLMTISTTFSSTKTAQIKYNYLVEKTLENENGVIYMEERELVKYLTEFPRDYDLFIFISTNNCFYCKTIEEPFLKVAAAYTSRKTFYPLRKENGDIRRPIFFIHTNLGYNSIIFKGSFRLKSYPNIYFSQADEIFITEEFEKQNYMDINFWRITMTDVVIDDAKIIEWCNKHSLYDIQLQKSIFGFLKLLIFVFAFLSFVAGLFYYADFIILNEKVWFIGALAIFTISAGGMYSFFHSGSPFIGQKKGQVEVIMAGSRNQYGIEGLLIIGCIFVIGFCLIAFSKLLKSEFFNPFVKYLVLFLLVQIAITMLSWLENVFKSKNFYNPHFFPTNYYIRGDFFTKDQGNIQ